jgi:hypothetical protein
MQALTITKRNYWLLKTMMETYRSNATSRLGCPSTPFPDTHISPSIAYIQLDIFSLELLSLGFGSLLRLEDNTHSLDLDGIYWMDPSLTKGDVHVPNSNWFNRLVMSFKDSILTCVTHW